MIGTLAILAQIGVLGPAPVLVRPAPPPATALAIRPFGATQDWRPAPLRDLVPDSLRQRPRKRAFEYRDGYLTRLGIHRALSWAMIPLFIGSGYTGFQLKNKGTDAPQWTRDIHGPLAGATAALFGMNTLTGTWNLIEGWKNPEGRKKRLIHSALFLAAGAGFTYVIAAGDNIYESGNANHWHRDVALTSMSLSVVSWTMMALFK
jgi:hypothetical protein